MAENPPEPPRTLSFGPQLVTRYIQAALNKIGSVSELALEKSVQIKQGSRIRRISGVYNIQLLIAMASRAQEDAVINLTSVQELAKDLGFQWTIVACELGFTRAEISRFHTASVQKKVQAKKMLESWYEKSWNKMNKTKMLQDALERAGRKDLADKLRCLHWGHQKLSSRVELPSAFPFLITIHKTINNREGLQKINQLSHK